MNNRVSCSFCNNNTFNSQYYCCDQNEVSCFGCKEFGCHVCRQRFTKRKEECYDCRGLFRREHLFGEGYNKFCVNCCRKDFGEESKRKFGITKFDILKDKFEVYLFLKKFCTACNQFLSSASQENHLKLKEILPLDNNLCNHCKILDPNMKGLKSPHRDTKGSNIRSLGKTSNEFFNDGIFNRDKPKCKNCNLSIMGSFQNINGNKICSICLKRPNEEEKYLSDSRMKLRSMYSGNENELEKTKTTQSSISSSKHRETSHNANEDRVSSGTKMSLLEGREKIKKLDSQEVILKAPIEQKFDKNDINMKQNDNQPIIKDEGHQKSFNKVKRTESWNEDIIMEPVADHEYRKKLSKMSSDKMSEIPETYDNQENDHHEEIVSRGSREEGLMDLTNDQSEKVVHRDIEKNDLIEKKRQRFGEESEPLIVEEQNNKNKVKRLESWNDEIILEPVEDHEKRKKEKIEDMKRSKIPEQDENEEETHSFCTHNTNYTIGINQPKPEKRETAKSHNQEGEKSQEKSKLNPHLTNLTKPEETKNYETVNPKDIESKYSFTSDKLKESRISTKSATKSSEASVVDEQNYDRRLRSSQMFNKDKIEEAANMKRTEPIRPETSNFYNNRNNKYTGNSNEAYSRQNIPSTYYQTYDKTKPFTSFPSTTATTRIINDGTGRYIPTSPKSSHYENIKTTTYRSPERETYYYSNIPNRQETYDTYTSPKQNYQESSTSRTSTSNIRESRTHYQSSNENGSKSSTIRICSSCSCKIIDSSRTFTLNKQPICEGCWDNYNRKKFDEPEMRRSGLYSKYNYY